MCRVSIVCSVRVILWFVQPLALLTNPKGYYESRYMTCSLVIVVDVTGRSSGPGLKNETLGLSHFQS